MSGTIDKLVQRRLRFTISLAKDDGSDKLDTYVLPVGLRASVSFQRGGTGSMGAGNVRIFGLSMDFMNKVSTLGMSIVRVRKNTIKVEAGDDIAGYMTVFIGDIQEAWIDLQGSPDTSLVISAFIGNSANLQSTAPGSYQGAVSAAGIMSDLAAKVGLQFENNGVNVMLTNHYMTGSVREQMRQVAADGHFNWDDQAEHGFVLAIWPKGGSRARAVVLLDKDSGMIGYPTVGQQNNIRITTLFNGNLAYGTQVKIHSVIPQANKTWTIYQLQHELASETPDGPWDTTFEAFPPDGRAPV